jgi:cell division protein FtsA
MPDTINILGIGITESEGLKRGVVMNIEKTVQTIQKAIEQAEQQAGIRVKDVIVGIAGDSIESITSKGIIGISNPSGEVTPEDVTRVLDESRNLPMPAERKILHVIPQEYIIDGQDGFIDPVGISGVRLEANVHIVSGMTTAIQNIHKCVERLGLNVRDIVLEPLASSYAVLDEEEKEVGVAIIDIGGGTSDIAIFEEKVFRYTKVIALAGQQVTNDIHKGLGITYTQAERIKREYGHCHAASIMQDDVFMIPGVGGRKPTEITKSFLCRIIQPRMEEIFEFAIEEIRRSGFSSRLGAGIVLSGGCSLLRGIEELAQEVFGMQVKIGMPSGVSYSGLVPEIKSPVYSTAVGLALHGIHDKKKIGPVYIDNKTLPKIEKQVQKPKKSLFGGIKDFLENL